MKAVLVIDEMPDICYKCPCYDHEGGWCQASNSWKTDRENGCPLKLLPNAITERGKWISEEYQKGWNAYRENLE